MSKVAVVFWSGTGNTQAMADAVAEGARASGADVSVFGPSEFGKDQKPAFRSVGCTSTLQIKKNCLLPLWSR